MKRKILLVVLIVIVLLILAGLIAFSFNIKSDCQINFLSNSTLDNGDSVEFQLVDAQANPLADKNLTIDFSSDDENQSFSIITDENGKGYLVLENQNSGSYNVTVSFAGDDDFNNCSSKITITVGETSDESYDYDDSYYDDSYSSDDSYDYQSSDYSSQDLSYDEDLNVNYDSDGNVVGGQNDGMSYEYIKNNHLTEEDVK